MSSTPDPLVQVAPLDHERCEATTDIYKCDISRLGAYPGAHVAILWVDQHFFANSALPVMVAERWQRQI